jgi:hypothetical protein
VPRRAGAVPSRGAMAASGRGGREGKLRPPSEHAGAALGSANTRRRGEQGRREIGEDSPRARTTRWAVPRGRATPGRLRALGRKGGALGDVREKGAGGWARGPPGSGGGAYWLARRLWGGSVAELGRQIGPTRGRGKVRRAGPRGAGPRGGGRDRPRQGEPAGPRGRAGPRGASWAVRARGAGWAEGEGGAARWAARRKRGEKGLGGFYFPFLCSNSSPRFIFHQFTQPQTKKCMIRHDVTTKRINLRVLLTQDVNLNLAITLEKSKA